MDKFTFGNRLYELRTQNNLTQKQLAMYLGVSNKAVSKWETGEAMPRVKTLQAIAQCFGITYSDLLSETPSQEKRPPYEVYYRNKIEAKEASLVNDNKASLIILFFLCFVKILLYLFNLIFVKLNILYSIASIALIFLFCIFYYKFKCKIVKKIKSVCDKEMNSMFCFLSIPFLHSILDAFVFYKHDLVGDFTLILQAFPLALFLIYYIMVRKHCIKTYLLTFGFFGALSSFVTILFWSFERLEGIRAYLDSLPPPKEISDPTQVFFVGLVSAFLLYLNFISYAIYCISMSEVYYLSSVIVEKIYKDTDEDSEKKRNVRMLAIMFVVLILIILWHFSQLFDCLELFEKSKLIVK